MSASSQGPFGASFIAVKRCCEAWNRGLDQAKAKNLDHYDCKKAAGKAFKRAMPFLCGEENIRAFIACVAEGVILGAFDTQDATKLVYIAQVALTGLPRPSSPAARSRRESSDTQPQSQQGAGPSEEAGAEVSPESSHPAEREVGANEDEDESQQSQESPAREPGITIQACAEDSSSPAVPHPSNSRIVRRAGSRPGSICQECPRFVPVNTPPSPPISSQNGKVLPQTRCKPAGQCQSIAANPANPANSAILATPRTPPVPGFADSASPLLTTTRPDPFSQQTN